MALRGFTYSLLQRTVKYIVSNASIVGWRYGVERFYDLLRRTVQYIGSNVSMME